MECGRSARADLPQLTMEAIVGGGRDRHIAPARSVDRRRKELLPSHPRHLTLHHRGATSRLVRQPSGHRTRIRSSSSKMARNTESSMHRRTAMRRTPCQKWVNADLPAASPMCKPRPVPVPSAASSAAAPLPAPTAQVIRPPEGLARGLWEAPAGAFYGAAGALFVMCGLYAARRAGLLPRRRTRP